MKITELYIYLLYITVIICTILFFVKEHYIIAGLLLLGNSLPGYAMAISLMEKNEN